MSAIKVLYIDDELEASKEILQVLETRGFQIYSASSGVEGLEKFNAQKPNVVLCDLNMPGMNGLEVLDALRKRATDLPVVLVTARGSVEQGVQAMKRGAHDFILKPLDGDRIEATIQKALERKQLHVKLHDAESDIAHLLATIPDLIYSLDAKGRFISVSPAVENLLGYTPSELIGSSVFDLIHPDDLQELRVAFLHSMQTGDSEVKKIEFRMLDKQGRARSFEVNRKLVFENGTVLRQDGVARDVTERKGLEQRLKLYSEQLEHKVLERTERLEFTAKQLTALNATSTRLTQIYKEEELLDEIPRLLTNALDFDRASLLLERDGELTLRSYCTLKDPPEMVDDFLRQAQSKDFVMPPHFMQSYKEDRTIFVPDLNADPHWPKEEGKPIRTKAVVASPLRVNNKPIGVIVANMQHHEREMDSQDVERVEMFSNMAGLALDNIHAYRSLEKKVIERTRSLKKVNRELQAKTKELQQKTFSLGRANVDLLSVQEELEKKNREMAGLFQEVMESNKRLQAILDASLSAIVMVDNDGKIISSNKRMHDFFCLEMHDLIGEPFDTFLTCILGCFAKPEAFLAYIEELQRSASRPEDFEEIETTIGSSFELQMGQSRFISIFSMPVHDESERELGRVWVFTDITKMKRADEQLRTIVEASPIPFIVSRKQDGKIMYANDQMAEIVGITRQELVGAFTPDYYYNPDDRKEVLAHLVRDGYLRDYEVQIRRADGSPLWMIFSIVQTEMAGDEVLIGSLYDINERKEAEEALRHSEERFRQLTENIKEAFWIVDLELNKMLYVSPSYEDIFNRSVASLYEDPDAWLECVHPDDHALLVSDISANQQVRNEQEFRIVWPDNSIRWIRSRAFPIRNTAGEIYRYCGVSEDITERVQAREELQRERNFVSAVLDTAGALVIVLGTGGRIIRFNRACEITTGYKFQDVAGAHFWDIFLIPSEIAKVRAAFDQILHGDFPNYRENYWLTKSGEQRLIAWSNTALLNEQGDVDFIIGTGIDITERKLAEENLRLYKQIFLNSNDPISILDPEGKFIEQNPSHEKLNGYSMKELEGKTPAILTNEETFQRVRRALRETGNYRGEIRSRPKKGKAVDVELSAFTVRDDAGNVTHRIGFARDITERKRAEAALQQSLADLEKANQNLRQTHAQLVQSEKMASLGMLVAGIAHEINTPIGAISSMHDTLKRAVVKLHETLQSTYGEAYNNDRALSKPIKIIQDANAVIDNGTERVTTIVRRLRSFARLDEAELKTADIHEGIEDTLTLVHHEIKHDITILRQFGKIPPIACFPGRLNQVYLNLIVNARQAIKDKGVITIQTSQRNGKVHIKFKDTGVGIPPDKLSKIFDPGFTTKGVGVGTGLGLSICYQIVQDHLGEIKAESKVGEGSTFTVILPMNLDELLENT